MKCYGSLVGRLAVQTSYWHSAGRNFDYEHQVSVGFVLRLTGNQTLPTVDCVLIALRNLDKKSIKRFVGDGGVPQVDTPVAPAFLKRQGCQVYRFLIGGRTTYGFFFNVCIIYRSTAFQPKPTTKPLFQS